MFKFQNPMCLYPSCANLGFEDVTPMNVYTHTHTRVSLKFLEAGESLRFPCFLDLVQHEEPKICFS